MIEGSEAIGNPCDRQKLVGIACVAHNRAARILAEQPFIAGQRKQTPTLARLSAQIVGEEQRGADAFEPRTVGCISGLVPGGSNSGT